MSDPHRRALLRFAAGLALALPAAGAAAQGPPEMAIPVGVAAAVNHSVRPTLNLSGTVRSRRASLVASEVAGLVEEIAARDGAAVRRGRPLVRLRRHQAELRLASARADLEEADARLRIATLSRERAERLFESGLISREELDEAVAEFDAFQGRVGRLGAEVARLEDDLERSVVRAPFDGVVVRELTAPGEWVAAGDPVAELVDVGDLEVTVEVPEQHFAGLAAGADVAVEVAGLPGESLTGTIRAIVPRADPQARTFPLKIALPNPEGKVAVGMLARVRVPVGKPLPAVLVPKDAVLTGGPSRSIFLLGDDERVRPVVVELGASEGEWVAVRGQVEAGDRVVIQGNERLAPGQLVSPRPVEVPEP